ncbi:hypothetical protein PENTCL1PPCAC_6221, partial [Pristionchus entomophagus]
YSMTEKNRSTTRITQAITPHRLKRRCATRVTATPRNANLPPRSVPRPQLNRKEVEEIETTREDWFSLPLPTSPAPSPPRPKEICPQSKCTITGNPNDTMIFTYRKIHDEKGQTQRDSLGRETAGRHRIPAREFTIDRVYMTPSSRAKEDHGIQFWPEPPMQSMDDSSDRDRWINQYHKNLKKITVVPTPTSREPMGRVHTTGRKPVARRRLRLFLDESVLDGGDRGDEGVMEGEEGVEGDNEDEEDGKTIEDTTSKSSSRKRRGSKMEGIKSRRCLYSGSVKSDGVRVMTPSEEEMKKDEEDNEEYGDNDEDGEAFDDAVEISGDFAMVNNGSEEEGGMNRTLEVEVADEHEEDGSGDGDRVDGIVEEEGSEEENEVMEEKEDGSEVGGEERVEMEEGEEESMEEKESSESEGTLREERSESEEEYVISDALDGHSRSFIGDLSLLNDSLPLDNVVDSIKDEDLRRLIATCNQKEMIDMHEFMHRVVSVVKVGEGGYADVFLVKRDWEKEEKVFKILQIEEDEDARKFLGEVIISKELTRLRRSGRNSTNAFAKLYRARVIKGRFHQLLSDAWEHFHNNDEDGINEDNPETFGNEQMFLSLEYQWGGLNLKKFHFTSIFQLLSVFCQTALALAVAESELKFEHRDLHEENVLVSATEETVIEFSYDRNKENGDHGGVHKWTSVPTHGIKTTIIDFTLSRITRKPESRRVIPGLDIYHVLGDDICDQEETSEQYEVYKKMKKLTKGKWKAYTPKSNVLWLRMQINWIIGENLNPESDINRKRLETSNRVMRMGRRRQSNRKSTYQEGEEERSEMSGEMWIKKLKEGVASIKKLKTFAKVVNRFGSADELVNSTEFAIILALLESTS